MRTGETTRVGAASQQAELHITWLDNNIKPPRPSRKKYPVERYTPPAPYHDESDTGELDPVYQDGDAIGPMSQMELDEETPNRRPVTNLAQDILRSCQKAALNQYSATRRMIRRGWNLVRAARHHKNRLIQKSGLFKPKEEVIDSIEFTAVRVEKEPPFIYGLFKKSHKP